MKFFIKTSVLLALITFSISVFAQKDDAVTILKQYGFTPENVFNVIDISSSKYSFTASCKTKTHSDVNNSDDMSTRVYSFDGNKKEGEKFTLVSVKGKEPSSKKIKKFNKEKNSYNDNQRLALTDKDFFVKSTDDNIIVIGFKMPKEELPSKMAYMAHATGYIYIDKKTAKITKIEIKSNEAFNMKIFHVVSLDINLNINYNEDNKLYYVTNETTNMNVLILGSVTSINIEEKYSNFKFK